ncbi:MAG: endolytic transglycosylase MltG [Patescibacteria group bacterium]
MPPRHFPKDTPFLVNKGDSIKRAAANLQAAGFIHSDLLFSIYARFTDKDKGVIAGIYVFDKPTNMFSMAEKMTKTGGSEPYVKVTIPEGSNNAEIAAILEKRIVNFSKEEFLTGTMELEGYLFPDTYHLSPYSSEDVIIDILRKNFNEKMKPLEPGIKQFGKPLSEVLIMAAIIEEEGKSPESKRMISDVLWKRLKDDMPLQVDVATSTYATTGLTPKPITNPGLESIQAAINPKPNPYWYYLSDEDGNFHYATSFEDHTANIAKYLK